MISIPYPTRFKHIYIPGGTGMGKSYQLLVMAVQDIRNGCGITVLDPKGDLVEDILHFIPKSRISDVRYITLDNAPPFDFLSFDGDTEKDELIDDIVFLLLGDAGNAPRAKGILMDVLYTLLSSTEPFTFLDIANFLRDKTRFDAIVKGCHDPELQWEKWVPKDDKLEPILSRFTKYRRNSILRQTFGTTPEFNIRDVMNERKILLVNLGGASRVARDYGSLLFMKMKQEVFRRHKLPVHKRIPHFLYIDEFQNFAQVEDFKDVLMMARGYKLALTLANPSYYDLPDRLKPGIGIIETYICYRLDPHDVPFFKTFYRLGDAMDLANLPERTAYYKTKGQPGVRKPCVTLHRPKEDYAEAIKATFSTKRTNLSPPCSSPPVRHDEGDDKDETISPSGPATIPME